MNIYVDESGNLGIKDRYFVIGMVICDNPKRIKNFVSRFCARKGISEIKSTLLLESDRDVLIRRLKFNETIGTDYSDHKISYIVLDKHQIKNPKLFEDKNLLYNFLFSFLIKDTLTKATSDVNILFDNHTTKVRSINSLADYIKIKAWAEWGFQHQIFVRYIDSRNSKCVQMADVIANSIYRKYNRGDSSSYNSLKIDESIKFPAATFGV